MYVSRPTFQVQPRGAQGASPARLVDCNAEFGGALESSPWGCLRCVSANFDEMLAAGKRIDHAWPNALHELSEIRVPDVATCHPDDLWWRAVPFDQLNEVVVLGDDDQPRRTISVFAGKCEDARILGLQQPDVFYVDRIDAELVRQPAREGGGKLRVNPDRQPRGLGDCHLRREMRVV